MARTCSEAWLSVAQGCARVPGLPSLPSGDGATQYWQAWAPARAASATRARQKKASRRNVRAYGRARHPGCEVAHTPCENRAMAATPELLASHNLTRDEYGLIVEWLGREPSLTELGLF